MSDTPDVRTGRVVIVGGVAGGMSTATRLRRLDAGAHITVLERSGHVSFANCGLPHFAGGLIEEEDDLTLQSPEQLFDRFRLDVRTHQEVIAIDRARHSVTTRSTVTGEECDINYDKLVLSMGAAPVQPPIPGYERVRTLRTVEDAARLASDVDIAPATSVVIGAGFIGLEMAENLVTRGIDVTIVEATPQVLPPLDPELAILVSDELTAHGVHVATGASVASIEESSVVLSDGRVNVLSGDCDVVAPHELNGLVSKGWAIIDVRTAEEHAAGAIEGSTNWPIDSLRDNLDQLGSGPVVIYCEVGQRGHTATSLLHELGIEARNLDGGYQTWLASTRAQANTTDRHISEADTGESSDGTVTRFGWTTATSESGEAGMKLGSMSWRSGRKEASTGFL